MTGKINTKDEPCRVNASSLPRDTEGSLIKCVFVAQFHATKRPKWAYADRLAIIHWAKDGKRQKLGE